MDGKLIFKKGWYYPMLDKAFHGDKKVVGYKASSTSLIEDDRIEIWFWSGSEYFNIGFLE